ncbi:hypothetical protein NDU88_004032 [Pleurodeles waltl]|uniref:Uncharacterized protein n=1 Tax=Pleurodeles waltl TaxID=8319 RepID=A0AAV7NLJ7_PLEWA|nr:hypothetical protein NDU88_004032 [Pleurodeles waltl]
MISVGPGRPRAVTSQLCPPPRLRTSVARLLLLTPPGPTLCSKHDWAHSPVTSSKVAPRGHSYWLPRSRPTQPLGPATPAGLPDARPIPQLCPRPIPQLCLQIYYASSDPRAGRTDGCPGPCCSWKGLSAKAHQHTSAHATIFILTPAC